MKVVVFCHSIQSDWNHGNAHFLRGICSELIDRGHRVDIWEPRGAWSLANLLQEHGAAPLREFERAYPLLASRQFDGPAPDLDQALAGAGLVLVHEWSEPALVAAVGRHRRAHPNYVLQFHDTHHRSATDPAAMDRYDLRFYDGVLAFGDVIRDIYLKRGWARRAWTWHEAADPLRFQPLPGRPREGDLVWVGNWGDEERTEELHEFLLQPAKRLGLKARVYGVRYPDHALRALARAGIEYAGWLPNLRVPEVFARYAVTVHVPRRPYARALPGIPTIRPFEALACGIPLVSAPWEDSEQLFKPGSDYLVARDGSEMESHLKRLLCDPRERKQLAERGRATLLRRHTCAHRVDELISIYREVRASQSPQPGAAGVAA